MSPIGRIFSVINLVLAALFLGWASVNLATSQEFKEKYETSVSERTASEEQLNTEISTLRTNLDTKSEAMDQVSADRDQKARDVDRMKEELASAKEVNSQLGNDLGKLTDTQQALQDQLGAQTTIASASQNARAEAETERDAAQRDQEAADSERAQVLAQNAALNNQISDLEKMLNTSGEMIASLETQLAQMQVLTGASLSDIIPQKKVNGTVVQALYDVSPGLVAINRGKGAGVLRGNTFEISNGTQYKGQVRVENVREDMCTCIILRVEPGQVIGQGDRADTVL